jgi:ATP-dependent Clp protease ATP-binding subunit ClpA
VVDRAAALARDARPQSVLADATTAELGRGHFEGRARDDGSTVVLKPVRAAPATGGAPFVGREAELRQILNGLERAFRNSEPALVTITGQPGIGKSRLRREVLARLLTQETAPHVVMQRSDAYGKSRPLGAVGVDARRR